MASAGVHASPGQPPSTFAVEALAEEGIDISRHAQPAAHRRTRRTRRPHLHHDARAPGSPGNVLPRGRRQGVPGARVRSRRARGRPRRARPHRPEPRRVFPLPRRAQKSAPQPAAAPRRQSRPRRRAVPGHPVAERPSRRPAPLHSPPRHPMQSSATRPRRPTLAETDPEIAAAIQAEELRQSENIELIASENFCSRAVREAQGSVFTNKYAEGYPGKRWYGGCENADVVEQLAIDRAKQLFGAEHANVQPHSGAQANMAVYFSVLQPGDKILTMDLSHGGHLTHGNKANFSGRFYEVAHYGVSAGGRAHRLRGVRQAGRGRAPEDDHRRRVGLPAHARFRADAPDRRQRRRAAVRGHGAHQRVGRGRAASQPGAARAFRHHDHAQEPARAARGHHPVHGAVRQGDRFAGVPRHPGRAADARHRGEGGVLSRGAAAGVRGVPAAGRAQRQGAGRAAGAQRLPARQRRHGQPPHAHRRAPDEPHRQGRAGNARPARPSR